ncbi:MAG: hypothetical protein H6925_03570 [Holosporaceae bacterium]|nr:MAG: hypothetical protein H6925_03570 [Holosporaceae bacterium]
MKFAFFLAALFLNNVQSGCFFKIYLENNSILVHLKNRLRDQLITDIDPSNLANFYELNTGREANNKPPYFGATTPKQNIVGYHMTITSPGTNQQKIRQAKLALRNFLRNDGSIEIQSIAHFNRYIVARVSPRYPPNMPAQRQTRLQGHWQTAFGNAPHISLIQLTDFQNPTSIGDNETSAASINRLRTVFRHPFNDSPDLRLYLGIQNYNDFLNLNQRIKLYDLVAAHVKQLIYDTPMPNGQATLRVFMLFMATTFRQLGTIYKQVV